MRSLKGLGGSWSILQPQPDNSGWSGSVTEDRGSNPIRAVLPYAGLIVSCGYIQATEARNSRPRPLEVVEPEKKKKTMVAEEIAVPVLNGQNPEFDSHLGRFSRLQD
uniref:Uncharacterized protein n=1 Tax=Anopheles culicifacies TaxID=139723 RepID=A0A182ML85_9DIPT